ncbi:hypothetical protein EXN66_Car003380 [Channa argus]|uniref:Uncharacterized protein n=1 Tax=Channa argus TaxID=215402 RepID=A0A6G1PCF2_CHAAH|nr:hypothetical protein EXN66_Car003380 [Channa argus]
MWVTVAQLVRQSSMDHMVSGQWLYVKVSLGIPIPSCAMGTNRSKPGRNW